MICRHCGKDNPDNSIFCQHCNGWIMGEVFIEPSSTTPAAPAEPPVEEDSSPAPTVKRKRWIPFTVAFILFTALIGILILNPWAKNKDYVVYSQDGILLSDHDNVFLARGNNLVELDIASEDFYRTGQSSCLDGSVQLITDHNGSLHLVKGETVQLICTNATRSMLSVNGQGLLYERYSDGQYFLYFQKTDMSSDPILLNQYVIPTSFAISPDGKTAAYISRDNEIGQRDLMYFDGSASHRIASTQSFLLSAIANGGAAFYTIGADQVNIYRQNAQSVTFTYTSLNMLQLYLNADHSQVLIHTDNETWVYDLNDDSTSKICEDYVLPVTPSDARAMRFSYSVTYPYYDLRNHVYLGKRNILGTSSVVTHPIWHMEDGSARKITRYATSYQLHSSGDYLYYIDRDKTLWVADLTDPESKAVKLAENVDRFLVTSDCKYVYYISYYYLYCCNGKEESEAIKLHYLGLENSNNLALNQADMLYYYAKDMLYVCKNGKSKALDMYPNTTIYQGVEGQVYLVSGNNVYCATRKEIESINKP